MDGATPKHPPEGKCVKISRLLKLTNPSRSAVSNKDLFYNSNNGKYNVKNIFLN